MGTEKAIDETPKSKGFRILERGTYKNVKWGPMHALPLEYTRAYKHTRS